MPARAHAKSKHARAPRLAASPTLREASFLLLFLLLTAAMTWPWVTRLRDAVANVGDPYMIAWTLWWDYHATFNGPLNLFHANVFYPHPYSLAFSEHDYGIALLFFPLFAAGFRPLTVHSFATFCGFAFCGYASFRLTRTLTGSAAAGLVAGVFFAFVPYRFTLLEHLHYLFAGWLPLLLEALVLFARRRSWRRAAWLGVAFVMNALTCVTWMVLALVPLALSLLFLVARYRLARDRSFWIRGGAAMAGAAVLLLPFLLPYYYVSELYGFSWGREEVLRNSPTAATWLVAEGRNIFWRGLGGAHASPYPLFPGLVAPLLALAAVLLGWRYAGEPKVFDDPAVGNEVGEETSGTEGDEGSSKKEVDEAALTTRRVRVLDALALASGALALVSAGWRGLEGWAGRAASFVTPDRALFVLALLLLARLSLAYPRVFRPSGERNLSESVRSARRSEAVWLGSLWAAVGFWLSLGMNGLLFRLAFEHLFVFRSQRLPARASMVAYVGLALLAGVGAWRVAEALSRRGLRRRAWAVWALLVCALLFELRVAPLRFVRGAVNADEVSLRLKETPMRGGLVELPAGLEGPSHLYMLRAADHRRPLVNATSSFVPPTAWEIHELTREGPINPRLLDLLESVPVSYVVVRNQLVAPERRYDYESFLADALRTGRLRFVRRSGEADDLYAVVKTEPEARQEAPAPAFASPRAWDELLREDPVHLLGRWRAWSLKIYLLHKATYGRAPRMEEFMPDMLALAAGVRAEDEAARLEQNIKALLDAWVERPSFVEAFGRVSGGQFVLRVLENAGLSASEGETAGLTEALRREGRVGVLRRVVEHPEFVRREQTRALVLLHYFAYLRRNPGDPPDEDWTGFDFWVREVESSGDTSRLTRAFMASGEHGGTKKP